MSNEWVVPKQVDIEVTAACNLRCKFCPRPLDVSGHMDPALFYSIIDRIAEEMPRASVVPWLNGEPLLHPEYNKFIRYITDRNLRAYITTNGTIWDPDLFDHITDDNSLYQIIFSLDGLPHLYSKSIEIARPGTKRVKVLNTIHDFGLLKMEKGNHINMAVKIVRRGQDWGEIEKYIGFWLEHEFVDYVCVGDALVDYNEQSMRIFPCQYSDPNFMVIKWDGRLAFCAYNDAMTNEPENSPGTVDLDTPLLDLYNNEVYRKFREDQGNGVFRDPCKHCGFAYTGFGFEGTVEFRDPKVLPGQRIYYHRDYYNQFFSLTKDWKPKQYYLDQGRV